VHLLSHNHYLFFLTGLWQRTFFPTGGRFHKLLRYFRKVGVTTLKTIVVWQYYPQNTNTNTNFKAIWMYNDLKILMSINQHGFMKNRSTITNLFEYASFVLNSIEDGNQLDSLTDFSKVFDRVRCWIRCLWVSSLQDACDWDLICRDLTQFNLTVADPLSSPTLNFHKTMFGLPGYYYKKIRLLNFEQPYLAKPM
jgi:hypothetical protein